MQQPLSNERGAGKSSTESKEQVGKGGKRAIDAWFNRLIERAPAVLSISIFRAELAGARSVSHSNQTSPDRLPPFPTCSYLPGTFV